MSKEHHCISVSITRHSDPVMVPPKKETIYASYSRTRDGKSKAAAAIGLALESEMIARAYLIVQCTRSQNTGFADCTYTRQLELYGAFKTDLDALREIEAECQGQLLGSATQDWRILDSIVLNKLGEVVYGSVNAITECSSGPHQ